jgi:branched-subunit amino acid ABC-type transport system permease component
VSADQFVELTVSGLAMGAVYGLIGLGFSMIIKATDIFHFAQGEVMMLGAMGGLMVAAALPMLPFVAVLLIGVVSGGAASVLIELVVYRTLRLRRVPLMNIIIATIGMSILLQNGSMLIWGSDAIAYPKLFEATTYRLGPVHVSPQLLWIVVLGIALMLLLQAMLKFTRTGIALQAAAQDPETAQLMGINLTRSTALTFALAGAMAGGAGVLLGSMFFASFNMGFLPGIKAFVAATLGGLGSIGGAMLGGLIFGLIEVYSGRWISSGYRDAVGMVLLILILLVLPNGLVGLLKGRR